MSEDTTRVRTLPPGYGTALQVANWDRAFNPPAAPPAQPWRWQRWGESAYLDDSAGPWRSGTWRPMSGIAIADAQRGRPDHRGSQRPCDTCGYRACPHPRAKAGW